MITRPPLSLLDPIQQERPSISEASAWAVDLMDAIHLREPSAQLTAAFSPLGVRTSERLQWVDHCWRSPG